MCLIKIRNLQIQFEHAFYDTSITKTLLKEMMKMREHLPQTVQFLSLSVFKEITWRAAGEKRIFSKCNVINTLRCLPFIHISRNAPLYPQKLFYGKIT